ncbi:MAG: DUF167 domain-containing protein [Candidatus ainarchaeum sp.]|nr:DUF167 domain-containing protein [Candidatus ainarchaeum sp.]
MQEFFFQAKIIANAPRFEIAGFNDCNELKIKVKSAPENNRANLELVRELKKNLKPKSA